jgi:4-hydroxy-tetrahydrodipicolinate synthase
MQEKNSLMTTKLQGIVAPALTALTENFQIDQRRTIAHFEWLLGNGCDGLVVFGTTSEANSFSIAERRRFLDQVVEAGIEPQKILVGTGCCALPDSVELTEHAIQIGCAGVLTLPPFYYKQLAEEGMFRYFASLIEGVSNDRLRLYLYHIPPIAVVHFSFTLIEKLAGSGFDVFPGSESTLLPALRIGAVGCISGVTNVSAPSLQTILRTWQSAEAEDRQNVVNQVRQVFQGYPLIPALKAVISKMRGEPAWKNVRPPLVPLPESALEGFFEKLDAAGFQWPS